ncbi:MFS transporter [Jannaschia seohaensis]|uniref:Fucose permease n=1 Tax=Jannaschia seohaensis TaxID=475081 RepID=A0A2Y9B7P0_9RHOB|nr:MFS transporter [Jannaschia seohaensis]PWJ12516.1 fucose permease [Jannaschia seohaensis]SSA50997.1 Fucose permease [Jannaschia seohaensis]
MSSPSARALVIHSFVAFALVGAAQALYGPSVPALARLHDILPSQAGAIVWAHAAGGFAGLLLNMVWAGVTARRTLAVVALGAGVMALAPSWAAMLAGAVLVGAGSALASAVFNRRFLEELGDSGPRMLGLLNALFGVGAVVGPLIFVAAGGGIAPAYGAVAVLALILSALAPGGVPAGAPAARPRLGAVLRRPGLLALGGLGVGVELTLAGLGPAALVERGMSETRAALWAAVFFGVFLAARVALWWLADRIAPLRLLAASFALVALACGAAALGVQGPAYALSGGAVALLFPAYFVAATRRLGGGERMAALIVAAGYLGATVVPGVMSLLLGRLGIEMLFAATIPLALLGAAGALAARAQD